MGTDDREGDMMGEVNIKINGRSFKLGCDDGEEAHLLVLAEHLGKHVANLRQTIGKAGDEQLYLMAGLMVCDELWEARDVLLTTKEVLKNQAAREQLKAISTTTGAAVPGSLAQGGLQAPGAPSPQAPAQPAPPTAPVPENTVKPKAGPTPVAAPLSTPVAQSSAVGSPAGQDLNTVSNKT